MKQGYSPILWTKFVNYDKRKTKELPYLHSLLEEYLCKRVKPLVMDSSAGTGPVTLALLESNIAKVIPFEFDKGFYGYLKNELWQRGYPNDVFSVDWRTMNNENTPYFGKYDMIVNHGNSLPTLDLDDVPSCLTNFFRATKEGGKLSVDLRNYGQILKGNFKWSGNLIYCGKDKVSIDLKIRNKQKIDFYYRDLETNETIHIEHHPIFLDEFRCMLEKSGYMIENIFGDYKKDFTLEEVEFFNIVARKS